MSDNIAKVQKLLSSITSKRAKIFLEHILKHGQVTTQDMLNYGYKHAPRAARDVRERGIPIITFHVKDSDGKNIAAYKLGDSGEIRANRLEGRRTFPKAFKTNLFNIHKGKCCICDAAYAERYLQVDHRVPYEVGGDDTSGTLEVATFMLLCGSCNRAKSWSCEHCFNYLHQKDPTICVTCYWAKPELYTHIATINERRLELVWRGEEVENFEYLTLIAEYQGKTIQELVKQLLSHNK